MESALDLTHRRADFPMMGRGIYFDTAATALKPTSVIEALTDFYTHHYGTVHRAIYAQAQEATAAYDEVREKVRAFLQAQSCREILFTRGTTASLNLLAHSFGEAFVEPGDVVLISEIEHHSNIVPWQLMCARRGAELKAIPVNARGEILLEEYENLLDERVKIVSIAHISNVLGTHHPVEEIIARAHAVGAKVALDGAQAVAHLPIDVQALDVDFYAFSGHKLYGPTGVGVLYGKEELLEKMPPVEGGGAMIERVTLEKSTYAPLPLKFEAGTPMIAEVIGLGAALDYLNQVGLEAIYYWEKELLEIATERLQEVPGLKIIGTAPKKGPLISFTLEGIHPLDLATLLDCRGIAIRSGHQCAQPALERFGLSSLARLSFGLYNTCEEIDQFIQALREIQNTLKKGC